MENWKDIPGYEGSYQASDQGNIRSIDRVITRPSNGRSSRIKGCVLHALMSSTTGYMHVVLKNLGKQKGFNIQRLVLMALVGESKLDANHINGCRQDNRLENLEWVTRRENVHHGFKRRNLNVAGVSKTNTGWAARICIEGKPVYLGGYKTRELATERYTLVRKILSI